MYYWFLFLVWILTGFVFMLIRWDVCKYPLVESAWVVVLWPLLALVEVFSWLDYLIFKKPHFSY